MQNTNNSEAELSAHLNQISTEELATWNQPRTAGILNTFIAEKLDSDKLADIVL